MYACHLHNHLPSATLEDKTSMEIWSKKPANDYDALHIFGCPTYYHVRDLKLDPRAKKSLFLRFSINLKGYRLWCLDELLFA